MVDHRVAEASAFERDGMNAETQDAFERADEWALDIYLQALVHNGNRSGLLKGLAACVSWRPDTERNRNLLRTALNT